MATQAQYRAFRAAILGDLLRLGHAFGAGDLPRGEYEKQHANLSLLLREVNQMELDERFLATPFRMAA